MLFCSVGDCYPCLIVGKCLAVPGWATRSLAAYAERGCGLVSGITYRFRRARVWFDRTSPTFCRVQLPREKLVCKHPFAATLKRSAYDFCSHTPIASGSPNRISTTTIRAVPKGGAPQGASIGVYGLSRRSFSGGGSARLPKKRLKPEGRGGSNAADGVFFGNPRRTPNAGLVNAEGPR